MRYPTNMAPSKAKGGTPKGSTTEDGGVLAMLQKISNQVGDLKAHQKKTDTELAKLRDKAAAEVLTAPKAGSGGSRQSASPSTPAESAAKTPARKDLTE